MPLGAPLENAAGARSIGRSWSPVRVPGHWQLEGAFAMYEGLVLYGCRFAHRGSPGGATHSLRFGGVYYAARVWLNGVYLGGHEGYFAPFEFDVTGILAAGENELLVEVYSPEEPDENDRRTVGGVWARWDGMAPHINPGGIFREVGLIAGGEVRIRSLGAVADHAGDGRAYVELYARRASRTRLVGRVRPVGFEGAGADFGREVHLEPGHNRFEVAFNVPRARAWWTWDRGEQPLYELTLRCGEVGETVRLGARTLELRDWKVYLNGERIFLRGINYLPTDAYPARASPARLRADASLVRGAGMNAVRVHAHVAGGGFYEACDEAGLLIFQDFPLQWTHRRSILEPATAQAREMARELRSHPSVGVYLAHDEPFYVAPPEKWSVAGLLRTAAEVLSPRWALWQRRVLDPAVVRSIEETDGSRPVIEAAGHPLTTNHLYFGWYYGRFRDLERAVKIIPGLARLPTEYGAQALPGVESLEEIWPPGRDPDWDALSLDYRLQVRPAGLCPGEPGIPGRGPQARHGAVPAAQVPADRGDLRLYAQRSGARGILVRGGLAAAAEGRLRGAQDLDGPGLDLREVSAAGLRGGRRDLPSALCRERPPGRVGRGGVELGDACGGRQDGVWQRSDGSAGGLGGGGRPGPGHAHGAGCRHTAVAPALGERAIRQRVRIPGQREFRAMSSGSVTKPNPLSLKLRTMWGTAATVWERSALGEASVSWPSCRRVTPPGRTPRRMRCWITPGGGRFQSQAMTDHPTHRKPSSAAVEMTCGPYQPWGTRKRCGWAPVAPWIASWARCSSSRTVRGRLQVRWGWVKVWFPTTCPEATSAARFGSRRTLLPTMKKVARIPSRSRMPRSCSVWGWQGPSSKVRATTRSEVRACQKTGP